MDAVREDTTAVEVTEEDRRVEEFLQYLGRRRGENRWRRIIRCGDP